MNTLVSDLTSEKQVRHFRQIWWTAYLVMIGGGLVIVRFARSRVAEPFVGLSIAVLVVLLITWTIRPRATLYATIFLTAVSDIVTVSWFPFAKNLSSRESISYVTDSLTISPLDMSLLVGFFTTTLAYYAQTRRVIPPSPLMRPLVIFTGLVTLGFVRVVLIGGADVRVAVLEGRPLFYVLLTFVIAVHVCTRESDLRNALWWALAGVMVQTLLSIQYASRLDAAERDALESLNEHGSALGHNLLLITALGVLVLPTRAAIARTVLLIASVPTVYIVLIGERRAGVAALAAAGVLLLTVLFWRHPRRFFTIAPVMVIATIGYLGAFWSVDSTIGFPAQAIKSIVAPAQASPEAQSSDLYRLIEANDVNFTIRAEPITGIGFGRPFYRPIPLPDISIFELNPYVPHNSMLWIWLKLGVGGFIAVFYILGKSIVLGARRVRDLSNEMDAVVAQSGVLFVVMFAVYTYVDISWDARNMVLLALACAICAHPVPSPRPLRTTIDDGDEAADLDYDRQERPLAEVPN